MGQKHQNHQNQQNQQNQSTAQTEPAKETKVQEAPAPAPAPAQAPAPAPAQLKAKEKEESIFTKAKNAVTTERVVCSTLGMAIGAIIAVGIMKYIEDED